GFAGDHDERLTARSTPGQPSRKFCTTFRTCLVEIRRYTVPGESGNKHGKSAIVEPELPRGLRHTGLTRPDTGLRLRQLPRGGPGRRERGLHVPRGPAGRVVEPGAQVDDVGRGVGRQGL